VPGLPAGAQDPERASRIFTGTVQDINRDASRVTLKTDLEKEMVFETIRPDLLIEVHGGDRITVQLNDKGKAEKVTKLTIPELPAAAPSGSAP
jgi:hypothetical protein